MSNRIIKQSLFTIALLGSSGGYAFTMNSNRVSTPINNNILSDNIKEVVFIAPDVREYKDILSSLNKNISIYQLERENTLTQINQFLSRYKDIKTIHIISHGSDGKVYLGDTILSRETLKNYKRELKQLGKRLSRGGDILFYGCNIAKSQIGKNFLIELSHLTSADISASDNITASTKLQGDSILEFKSGKIEAKTLLTEDILKRVNYQLTTSFVKRTGSENPLNGVSVAQYAAPRFIDIDNDGDFDAFIGEHNGNINYYKNTGNNTTPTFTQQTGSSNPFNSLSVTNSAAPTFVDIDNDGDFDVFIGMGTGYINYYKNTGNNTSPTFTKQTGSNNPFDNIYFGYVANPTFVDIDNDGDFDAFIGNWQGIKYYKNTGNNTTPTFTEQTGADNPFSITSSSTLTFVDIDNDGDFDAFIGEYNGNIKYYKNTGNNTTPTFVEQIGANNLFNGINVGQKANPRLVDINNDSKFDSFVGGYDGNISYYIINTYPTTSNVAISGSKVEGEALSGNYDYSDADNHTENGSTFKWYRADDSSGTNASAISGATSKNYTLTTDDVGKYINFSVTPKDGISFGDEVNSSYSTKVRGFVTWTLENNSTNEDSNLVIDLSNYATDPEGNTSMLYGAESNDTSLATVSVSGSTLTITPIENKSGIVGVTTHVFDGDGNSSKTIKITITAVNDKPTATNVDISGTVVVNQTLTGSYNYSDVENSSESGTTFQWYRADSNTSTTATAITGGTNKEYTLTTSDVGKYIKFAVKPNDGIEFGDEVNSSYSTKVRGLPATWSLEDNSTKEDTVLKIDLSKYATDPEGNTSMVYGAESNDTSLATVIVTNSMLSVIPVKDKSGVVGVTTHVFDGDGNSSKTIKVTITAVTDSPSTTDTNTTDSGFATLPTNINQSIASYIMNKNGYDYIAFSDSDNGNKLSVYKKEAGSSSWSSVVSTNISDNAITSISYFDIDGMGNMYVGYSDSISGAKFIMYDGTNFISFRGLKKRTLGANWSDISPPAPFNTGKFITTITDKASNIYTAFQDTTNSYKRAMLMRYDGSSWQTMTHDKIRIDDNATTNYFSTDEVKDISMVIDSTNRLYIAYTDNITASFNPIVIQTYSISDNNISYLSGAYGGFISHLQPRAKRVLLDVNSSDNLHIAYITDENNLTVMDYNGSWNYVGIQSIVDNVVSTELGFVIDKSNVPYVAFVESANTNKIKIKKYVNSSWSDVDTISASGVVNNLSIIKDSANNPYISFNDEGDSNSSKVYFLERYKTLTVREDNLSVGAVNINADTSLTFSLNGTDSSLFDINSSGYITIKSKLDYENPTDSNKDNYYEFNVSATDVNSKVARLFVKVKVEDVNNSKISGINISNSSIAENSTSGTKVGDFNITAVDIDGNIEYKLCDNTTTDGTFSISSNSLLTAKVLDYETKSSYKVCIKVTDLGTTASYEENLSINVTDVGESSSSGVGFVGGSSSVVKNSDRFTVNTSSGLQKNTTETSEAKIIETIETLLSSGESSKTRVEIPKNEKVTTLKAIVEVTNSTQTTKTILQTEEGVDILIESDKSITSKVSNDNIEAKVKVNSNAEAETKIIVQKRVEVTMKTPKGSEIKQEMSGRVTSNVTLKAITKSGVNPVEVKMSAEVEGNLIANAKVTDESGEVQTFNLSLPNSVTSGGMELIASESDSNIYSAIKSIFKTSEDFILNLNSKRVVVDGSNIQIVGTTAWQKFEETLYFDGRRTIKLLLGGANIIMDGVEEVMVQNKEYEFTPTDSSNSLTLGTTSEVTTLNTIYSNSYLTIRYGWNLISTPIDEELNIKETFSYATQSYKYSGEWIRNPTTLKQNEGFWIKYSESINEKIEGESYEPIFNNLSDSWNLLGAGRDINLYELNSFSQIWAYDSKVKTWVKNPTTIKRGYGFWAK